MRMVDTFLVGVLLNLSTQKLVEDSKAEPAPPNLTPACGLSGEHVGNRLGTPS